VNATKPITLAALLQAAEDAHAVGEPWASFWHRVGDDVKALVPFDRAKYRRVYNRLLSVAVSGDTAGICGPRYRCWWIGNTDSKGRLSDSTAGWESSMKHSETVFQALHA
jgi:hypothetical protein